MQKKEERRRNLELRSLDMGNFYQMTQKQYLTKIDRTKKEAEDIETRMKEME